MRIKNYFNILLLIFSFSINKLKIPYNKYKFANSILFINAYISFKYEFIMKKIFQIYSKLCF